MAVSPEAAIARPAFDAIHRISSRRGVVPAAHCVIRRDIEPRRSRGEDAMMVARTIVASYFAVAAVLSACAHSQPVGESFADSPALPPDPVKLQVENHNWADIVLYIVHDGVQTRFTNIAAAHDVSMEIPAQLQGQMGVIRLAVRRIGGTDSYVSQAISLRGNSEVRFTIESSLSRSSVGVW